MLLHQCSDNIQCICPNWPAPSQVQAWMTTRVGGVSEPPYQSLNLAEHVGDQRVAVCENRRRLAEALQLPSEPCWINQVHGVRVLDVDAESCVPISDADGSLTRQPGRVLAVLTADCLPVFITHRQHNFIMLLHAGWRGVANGIIRHGVQQSAEDPHQLMAWIGPGIGKHAFEVDAQVRAEFLDKGSALETHFTPTVTGKWLGDLATMAQWQCQQLGMYWVGASEACTYSDATHFFSYRREGDTGRMASLLWLSES